MLEHFTPYLTDFKNLVPKPPHKQKEIINYMTHMIATAKGEEYQRVKEAMDKFSVSPDYISQRQIYVFPDNLEEALKTGELPDLYEDLKKNPMGADIGERMRYYDQVTSQIIRTFYEEETQKPDEVIHVTCGGYISPSPIQRVMNEKRWLDVTVTHSYHMGCYGAFPPVRMAMGFLGDVDIIHTELIMIHLDCTKDDANNLINMTLFADGFIKYKVKTGSRDEIPQNSLKIIAKQDLIIKDSLEEMSWIPGPHQFEMYLSKNVPLYIRDNFPTFVRKLCHKTPLDFDNTLFAIHPGGPKILDHIQDLLSLKDWQLAASRDVLFENGNMSSATIPHIWKKIAEDKNVKSGTHIITAAFGPGLTMTGFILEKV